MKLTAQPVPYSSVVDRGDAVKGYKIILYTFFLGLPISFLSLVALMAVMPKPRF